MLLETLKWRTTHHFVLLLDKLLELRPAPRDLPPCVLLGNAQSRLKLRASLLRLVQLPRCRLENRHTDEEREEPNEKYVVAESPNASHM